MRPSVQEMKAKVGLHEVARRLGIAGWPGKTGAFCSPLRPDSNESFSIFDRNGELFWKDHATGDGGDSILLIQNVRQCGPKEAIEWLAKESGLDQPSRPSKKTEWKDRKLTATYDYRDAEGKLRHQTLRFASPDGSKTFLQRRPAAEGESHGALKAKRDKFTGQWWIWSLQGIEPVLYNLPALAARPDEPVVLVEGEKDADSAVSLGLLATTSPMGAGKWRPSFSEALRGRKVAICPDRDEPGERHAVLVSKALEAVGCEVLVTDWKKLWPGAPAGKLDFTDWVSAELKT